MKRKQLFLVCMFCLLGVANNVKAQSWKDIFNTENISKVVDTVNEITGNTSAIDMTGTWGYTGSAVEFKSDNLLQKAGGTVAASTVESKLNTQLSKVGITAGVTTFTFNADSTFVSTIGKKTVKGTYVYDPSTSTVNLLYGGLLGMNAKVSGSSNSMSLLFDADKLLQLITLLGSKINNTTVQAITSIAQSYDGMMLGLEMKK